MELTDGTDWQPEPADVETWKKAYPAVDVLLEFAKMESWIMSNPTKRKTPRGVKRFVNSWLARAQDQGGSSPIQPKYKQSVVKSMSTLDDLTHNFVGCPEVRKYFIEKHGQCYEDGVRYTA